MVTATVVAGTPRRDAVNAHASYLVAEGGTLGNVEYAVSTPLLDSKGQAKTLTKIKADLATALQAARAAQLGRAETPLDFSGSTAETSPALVLPPLLP